jgi:hypothetical protein
MQAKDLGPTEGQGETQTALRAIKFDAAGPFLFEAVLDGSGNIHLTT